ncbi:MAG: DNA-processing protein DprA [bacterium]|nr:DNA-processing protein DprA [bacterium]
MNNLKFWTAFASMDLDPSFIQRLYNYFGDIEIAFNSTINDLKQIEELSIKKAENFIEKRNKLKNLDEILDYVLKKNIQILTYDDDKYPYMLRQISNPPMCLFYQGDLFSCNLEKTVAFVGSRRASLNGKDGVNRVIGDLKNTDICIVSGLATGIDATSHRAALDNNLKTIGVIASGLNFTYPDGNKDLYDRIKNGGGAVISEYYPTIEPLQFRFPQRNRIVTGLSYGTVVGEAALKSGALISANLTLEQGRELMCIPGAINNTNTEGVYKLLKDGATMVTKGEDILNALNWTVNITENNSNIINNLNLNDNEKIIFDIIGIEPKGFDEIQALTNMETNELLMCLTGLELNGLIEQAEGDRYKRSRCQ